MGLQNLVPKRRGIKDQWRPKKKKRERSAGKALKLLSGLCCLPHPNPKEFERYVRKEDAHFICADEQAIGVADGYGDWKGPDVSWWYSWELMSNSAIAIRDEPKGSIDPLRVLEKAHSNTKAGGLSSINSMYRSTY
ncbi:hypothetical protein SLEP1_g16919 [Rubroshorea leprosula]|uniref:Protein phosphatase n=1 Tax=Rubroshorea leprosula TaxID=152421 RepID=A0AAV5J1J2_9ROSI|nr:hypothetical protein SLEP1_g16919 [Rubroshorea leprosula]